MKILSIIHDLINEAAAPNPARVYSEIKAAVANSRVGLEDGGHPTKVWLSGITQNRGSGFGKATALVKKLNYMETLGEESPEFAEYAQSKEYRDAFRFRIALDKLLEYGMIQGDDNGRYVFPSTRDKVKLAKLSDLRKFLTSDFHDTRTGQDQDVQNREAKYGAVGDAMNGVPEEHQAAAKLYSRLTTSAFNLLVNLNKKRGPKDVANFRDTINRLAYSDSTDLALLRELGFINDKNLLNRGTVSKLAAFMKGSTEAQKMALNPEIGDVAKRSQHNRQRAINAAGKTPYGEFDDTEAELNTPETSPEFADDANDGMTDEERRAKYSRIRDVEAGTKNSSKNDRARGYNHTYSDMFKNALN